MRHRLTFLAAALTAVGLIAGVSWAAAPTNHLNPEDQYAVPVADAGEVVLADDGGVLEVVDVSTQPGWTAEIEVAAGVEVEIDFRSGSRRVQFNAELEAGEVRVRIRERLDGGGTAQSETTIAGSSTSTPGTIDDSPSTVVDDDHTSTTIDDSHTSTTIDDAHTSTTIDDAHTSTTIDDDHTSTTIDDDHTSTTIDDDRDDAPSGSGSQSYDVAGIARVDVAWSNGVMTLAGVSASDGWQVEVKKARADRIEIEFESGDREARFEARFDDGQVRVETRTD
jgi:hypothetical protein